MAHDHQRRHLRQVRGHHRRVRRAGPKRAPVPAARRRQSLDPGGPYETLDVLARGRGTTTACRADLSYKQLRPATTPTPSRRQGNDYQGFGADLPRLSSQDRTAEPRRGHPINCVNFYSSRGLLLRSVGKMASPPRVEWQYEIRRARARLHVPLGELGADRLLDGHLARRRRRDEREPLQRMRLAHAHRDGAGEVARRRAGHAGERRGVELEPAEQRVPIELAGELGGPTPRTPGSTCSRTARGDRVLHRGHVHGRSAGYGQLMGGPNDTAMAEPRLPLREDAPVARGR